LNPTIMVKNEGTAPLTLVTIGNPLSPFSRTGGTCQNDHPPFRRVRSARLSSGLRRQAWDHSIQAWLFFLAIRMKVL
jgi:hypothetical protein